MQLSEISWDEKTGTLTQSGVRYVLMRPDVVMGATRHVSDPRELIGAMTQSAFENAQDSFVRYRESGALNGCDPVEHGCSMAGQLGWGSWSVTQRREDGYSVRVDNSPFAIPGSGESLPMCGWIAGVLKAVMAAHSSEEATVEEVRCAAQGHDCCEFEIKTDR